MFPTKILLATDGSAEARWAARMATTVSEGLDSQLHVAYVAPMPDPLAWPEVTLLDPEFREQMHERAESAGREALGKEMEKLKVMGADIAGFHVRAGRPDAEIVGLAEELGAGLVVVGSRGLGPIRRAVMGSVSGSVVRHAHCPVMVVRGDTRDGEPMGGPILVAVDGSEESKLAAQAAGELSGGTDRGVHIIYVLPAPARTYGHHFYSADMEKQLLERGRAEAKTFLDAHAESIRSGGGKADQTYLGTGRPDDEIVKFAEEVGAGMIVMGSRGLGGVRRALLGSVSESVVRHAHCPVLVVRQGHTHESVVEPSTQLGHGMEREEGGGLKE
jgi:nucleotide-binding universal stress UspA family protein